MTVSDKQKQAGRNITPHRLGVALVLFSAVLFSTAGLFTKGVEASTWDVIFWRSMFAALFTTGYTLLRGKFRSEFIDMGKSGLAASLVGGATSVVFITAFRYTSIANVSLIYAATPLIAALLAWMWIGERATRAVVIACIASIAGVGIIVGGSLGGVNITGDVLSCFMALGMAVLFVIYRRYPGTPAAGPSAMSSVVLLPITFALGTPLNDAPHEIFIMAAFGLVFAFASVTLAEGAKRLSAGETSLISILEVAFAPLFAFLLLGEIPAPATWIGGALIVGSVIATQIK